MGSTGEVNVDGTLNVPEGENALEMQETKQAEVEPHVESNQEIAVS